MSKSNSAVESQCGIYRIFLAGTKRSYVGQAKNIHHRWSDHERGLQRGNHHAKKLQRAWNKYGSENFKFEVLELCPCDALTLLNREQYWMDVFQAYKLGFNCSKSAGLSTLGTRHSPETRAKIGAKARGRVLSDETKEKIRQKMKDRGFTIEHRNNLSITTKKRMLESPDRLRLAQWSSAHPQEGEANSFYGRRHSEGARQLIGKANQGREATPELRATRSKNASGSNNPMFGRTHSTETKEKIRQARLNRVSK